MDRDHRDQHDDEQPDGLSADERRERMHAQAQLHGQRRHEFPPWGWGDCVVGLVAAFIGLLAISTVLGSFVPRSGQRNEQQLLIGLLATLIFEVLLFGIAAGITAGRYHGGLRPLGWRPRAPDHWFGWSILALVSSWVTLGLYAAITFALKLNSLQPKSNVPTDIFDHRSTVVLATFLTVVVAPICEESFFRGFLFNGLRRSFGFAGAAAVSGVLFAVAHTSTGLIIPFTVVGVIFAYVYYRTGTLWTNVTTHCLFNLVSVLFALGTR